MDDRLTAFLDAGRRAVQFQLGYQQADGGYHWEGFVRDAYHKQPYSWGIGGAVGSAHRLLTWARDTTLGPDGCLRDYAGDVYKHSWFCQGAHRLMRFDLSYPVLGFLRSSQAPCGGLPHFAGEPWCRALSSCCAALSFLLAGDLPAARRVGEWGVSLLEQQPDPARFYYRTTLDGHLVTPEVDAQAAYFIDQAAPRQPYWELGLPLQVMVRLHQATGEARYLELAARFFARHEQCAADRWTHTGSGKSALAAALYYLATGHAPARDAAYAFGEFLLATQLPNGAWRDPASMPDELLYYLDCAAEFNVWLQEVAATLAAADQRWAPMETQASACGRA